VESLQRITSTAAGFWNGIFPDQPLGGVFAGLAVLVGAWLLRGRLVDLLLAIARRFRRHKSEGLFPQFLEAASRPLRLAVLAVAIHFAAVLAGLSKLDVLPVGLVTRTLLLGFVFWTLLRMLDPLVSWFLPHVSHRSGESALRDFVVTCLRLVVFLLGVSTALQEWGFHVVALLGSLGILGAALALGAKELFSDLLAGVVLLTERIAERGDWIRTPEVEGTVERIGLRATRVRRFDKTLTSVPNHFLADRPLINFSRMTQRRIYWTIGVEYRAEASQIQAIVADISEFIHQHEGFETDPAKVSTFVFLDSFGDSSVNIMVYCFTKTTVWGEWLALKEELAFAIKRIVEGRDAGFAFPSTSVYVESLPFGNPDPFPAGATQTA
jgi:MscS family membrane protein